MENKVEQNKVETVEVPQSNVECMYDTAYDMLKSLFWHITNKTDCKGAKLEDASIEDKKSGRNEVGWKCSKCGQSWRIPLRSLRNTIRDARLKEFGGYSYMNVLSDLRKIMSKRV